MSEWKIKGKNFDRTEAVNKSRHRVFAFLPKVGDEMLLTCIFVYPIPTGKKRTMSSIE